MDEKRPSEKADIRAGSGLATGRRRSVDGKSRGRSAKPLKKMDESDCDSAAELADLDDAFALNAAMGALATPPTGRYARASSLSSSASAFTTDTASTSACSSSSGGGATNCPRHWTTEEDQQLRAAVQRLGPRRWKAIAEHVPGRSHTQCLQRWNKCLKPGLLKGPWSPEEDHLLRSLVDQSLAALQNLAEDGGEDRDALLRRVDWSLVAENVPGRSVKQCRERWASSLAPDIRRDAWTLEEDQVIVDMQAQHGNCWARIARLLPGRTEHGVKTRFRSIQRARRREWTPDEDRLLMETYAVEGSRWDVVAAPFKGARTRNAVMTRFKQLQGLGLIQPSRRARAVAPRATITTATGVAKVTPSSSSASSAGLENDVVAEPPRLRNAAPRLRAFDSMAGVEECALQMLSSSAASLVDTGGPPPPVPLPAAASDTTASGVAVAIPPPVPSSTETSAAVKRSLRSFLSQELAAMPPFLPMVPEDAQMVLTASATGNPPPPPPTAAFVSGNKRRRVNNGAGLRSWPSSASLFAAVAAAATPELSVSALSLGGLDDKQQQASCVPRLRQQLSASSIGSLGWDVSAAQRLLPRLST